MNTIEALKQLKAFARQDGAILALIWTAGFLTLVLSTQALLSNLIALSTPFVVGWRLFRFRNHALDGVISFRRALVYSWYTFFYASIAFALVQYLYLQFIDHSILNILMQQSMETLKPMYNNMGMQQKEINEAAEMLVSMNTIELVFFFLIQNIVVGLVLSLPIATIGKRRR